MQTIPKARTRFREVKTISGLLIFGLIGMLTGFFSFGSTPNNNLIDLVGIVVFGLSLASFLWGLVLAVIGSVRSLR